MRERARSKNFALRHLCILVLAVHETRIANCVGRHYSCSSQMDNHRRRELCNVQCAMWSIDLGHNPSQAGRKGALKATGKTWHDSETSPLTESILAIRVDFTSKIYYTSVRSSVH